MTDLEELFRPLIEEGARHREPVEAIETRARQRQTVRRRRQRVQYRFAAAFVVVALVATFVGVANVRRGSGGAPEGPIATSASPPSSDVTPTVPPGWKTYDYGLARVSVPPDYTAATGTVCPAASGPVLQLTPTGPTTNMTCLPGEPTVTLAQIGPETGSIPPGRHLRVNGIDYISSPSHCGFQPSPPATLPPSAPVCEPSIWVPSLNVVFGFFFAQRDRVADIGEILATLTHSTYSRLLQQPFGPVPASWKTVALDGYVARVPASWSVVRGAAFCAPAPNTAFVGSGTAVTQCPPPGLFVALPRDSVHFERDDATATPPGAVIVRHNGLRFARTTVVGGLPNQIHFTIDGPHGRLDVTLTLGLDPAVARGIVGSLKMP